MIIVELILSMVMFLVELVRRDHFSYINPPEGVLSLGKRDGILKLGHALPSIASSFFIALWLMPRISSDYAQSLELNEPVIPICIVSSLFPILFLNGFLIEIYLEKNHKGYKEAKENYLAEETSEHNIEDEI